MTTHPDPLGESLEAYLQNVPNVSIKVKSNIAPDDIIPVSYLFRDYAEMPQQEHLALELCRGNILDAGAGAGSHALWLQQHGHQVTALDFSEKATLVMRHRGLQNVIREDIWQFRPQEKFDTVLLLMNGIGLAGTLQSLEAFLIHLKNYLLAPDGQILLESADILYMFEEEDGSVMLDLNADYYGEVQYQMEFNGRKGQAFPWLFIDYPLLAEYAAQAGFEAEMLFEGEEGQYLAKLQPRHV